MCIGKNYSILYQYLLYSLHSVEHCILATVWQSNLVMLCTI